MFRDIVMLIRDTGMRNKKELYQIQIENIDWKNRLLFLPESKSEEGRRAVVLTDRAFGILERRCRDEKGLLKKKGWVFPARKKTATNPFLTSIDKHYGEARARAGLPFDLKLYCGRHDYGTIVYQKTGNLALVMKAMGHKDVKSAMQYQHPELDLVRTVLNQENRPLAPNNG
jgi:integrase